MRYCIPFVENYDPEEYEVVKDRQGNKHLRSKQLARWRKYRRKLTPIGKGLTKGDRVKRAVKRIKFFGEAE